MNNTVLIAILAAGGALAACWSQVKNLLTRVVSLFVVFVTIEDSPLTWAVRSYCFSTLRQSRIGVRHFGGSDTFVRPLKRVQSVGYERIGAAHAVFWKGWRPLWVMQDLSKDRGVMRVGFLRGTFSPETLLVTALDHYNDLARTSRIRRYRVVHVVGKRAETSQGAQDADARQRANPGNVFLDSRVLRWGLDELGPELAKGSAVDGMVLPKSMESAVGEARFWRTSEDWYRERGIPWRRGWLLHGAPGTGKTSLARAVAEDLDLPVFAYDLSSLGNDELREAWSQMRREAPCMALFEDIDGVFDGRKNVSSSHNPLTFDCLLNCIDGVERTDGLFLVITTNDIKKIDSAIGIPGHAQDTLSSRPGRIDRVIELAAPDERGLARVCERVLAGHPELWRGTIRQGADRRETVAQFQERCARVALSLHWRGDADTRLSSAADRILSESGVTQLQRV